jgi:hypothetical protein
VQQLLGPAQAACHIINNSLGHPGATHAAPHHAKAKRRLFYEIYAAELAAM